MAKEKAILEPLAYYEQVLKEELAQKSRDYFDQLVQESAIDIEENKRLLDRYQSLTHSKTQLEEERKAVWIKFLLLLIPAGLFFLPAAFSLLRMRLSSFFFQLLVALFLAYFPFRKFLKVQEMDLQIRHFQELVEAQKKKCFQSMEGLNRLFTSDIPLKILQESLPLIKLDPFLDDARRRQWEKSYGLEEKENPNASCTQLLSASILGNPLLFLELREHCLTNFTYRGERTVTIRRTVWENGVEQEKKENQTLQARVQKPGPAFRKRIYLLYGNPAAPQLSFSRRPLEKEKKKAKKEADPSLEEIFPDPLGLDPMQEGEQEEENPPKKATFQAMANSDFEEKFHAWDRDQEVEFRLLFTPLAQENILQFLGNPLYGDDLFFRKRKKINAIYCKHSDQWDFENKVSGYQDFSFARCKEKFQKRNEKYWADLYYTLLPLLSIPIYQQMRASDGEKEEEKSVASPWTWEMLANHLEKKTLFDPATNTEGIIKCHLLESDGKRDRIEVTSLSYQRTTKVDIVKVQARDGKEYEVQVPWYDYTPFQKSSILEVERLPMEEKEFLAHQEETDFQARMKELASDYAYHGHLLVAHTDREELVLSKVVQTLEEKGGEDDQPA